MSRRLLMALVIPLGLAAIVIAQLSPNRHRIEDDLTRRATAALTAAGLPDAHVTFTGRDGLVVTSASGSARAHDVVAAVDGVRAVRTRVVVTQAVPAPAPGRPQTPAGHVEAAAGRAAERIRLRRELDAVPHLTFRTGGTELTPGSRARLRRTAALLVSHPGARIRIEGHTDSRGSRAANLVLSRDRADTIRAELRKLGVAAGRMTVIAHGETRPEAAGDTPAGRAENRRVELTVL
jgi:outer membrane protein OmpA-like peptidoglycan-associated protein